MSLLLFRILFFCLVPIGIFILVKSLRLLKATFNGRMIAEVPFSQKTATFTIAKAGVFGIWHKGQMLRRTPVDKFALRIFKDPTGEEITLAPSVLRPHVNGFGTGRMEIQRFSAEAGNYLLAVEEGTSISSFEKLFSRLFPLKPVDYNKYFIQIRESSPVYYPVIAIPLLLLCAFCIIGGLVAGFAAPHILQGIGIPFLP